MGFKRQPRERLSLESLTICFAPEESRLKRFQGCAIRRFLIANDVDDPKSPLPYIENPACCRVRWRFNRLSDIEVLATWR
jgi:hypothetical protein